MESNTTGYGTTYTNYCESRLPCGLCRLTNSMCPLWSRCGLYPNTTITSTDGTGGVTLYKEGNEWLKGGDDVVH